MFLEPSVGTLVPPVLPSCHLPVAIVSVTGHKSKGRAPPGKPHSLILLLAFLSSLSRPQSGPPVWSFPPDYPSVEVGPSQSPCGFRGSPRPVYFHRSPGLPYTHSRVVPSRASPARSPLVAVLDGSKGVVPRTRRVINWVVCVCVFFPFVLDVKIVGCTSRGHKGERSQRIYHPPSFCSACLYFSRENDSAVTFPRRP